MIKNLLFDLDGTLLSHDIKFFMSKYAMAMALRFSGKIPIVQFGHVMLNAGKAMMKPENPPRTIKEKFLGDFLPQAGMDPEQALSILDDFYRKDFPQLKRYTKTNPLAREIVKESVQKGFNLAMATNPVFPECAIMERMKWAAVADFPYKLITHYENMHFCKPDPNYYKEILCLLNTTPDECLMIGNDNVIDLAASEVGISTYLVTDFLDYHGPGGYKPDYEGTLMDLLHFIQALPSNNNH